MTLSDTGYSMKESSILSAVIMRGATGWLCQGVQLDACVITGITVEVGRDLLRSSSPTPLLMQGHLEQVVQGCVQCLINGHC